MNRPRNIALGCATVLLLASPFAFAADDLNELAERLIALRSQVESLHDDIEAKQQDHRNRMNSLATRRTTLESEIQGKELQLRQLRQAIAEQREKNRIANESSAAITPTLKQVAGVLTTYVDGSLPFKLDDRRRSVKDLIEKVEKGDMSAPQGLNRLWTLYEDEFRLTRENGLFRQEIVLDGKEQLSDVIRLGSMMLFFQSSDGRNGFAEREGDAWTYTVAEGSDATAITELFSTFEKQVRSGFFTLPNALAGEK